MTIIKERIKEKEKEKFKLKEKNYGLLLAELDSMYGERNFVAAYGDLDKVMRYKEECNLTGELREYKTQSWLVKRLETIKGDLKKDVKIIYID